MRSALNVLSEEICANCKRNIQFPSQANSLQIGQCPFRMKSEHFVDFFVSFGKKKVCVAKSGDVELSQDAHAEGN